MRKTLLLAFVLLVAIGTIPAAPDETVECPSGEEFWVSSPFTLLFGTCWDEHWAFEPYEEPYCRSLQRYKPNNGLGYGRPHYDGPIEGYLALTGLETDRPVVRTIPDDSHFLGDWRALDVVSLSTSLMAREVTGTFFARPVSLVLINDSGTPDDQNDDCHVYFVSGETTPVPKNGGSFQWEDYEIPVPSGSVGLPQPNTGGSCPDLYQSCWGVYQFNDCPTKTDYDLTWSTVIQDVDGIQLVWGHPEQEAQVGAWTIGVDYISRKSCQQP